MLKNVPSILSPALLKVLMEMGHGDEIVLGDGNFPAESMGKNAVVIRADGHSVPELLDAILTMMPLDQYTEKPARPDGSGTRRSRGAGDLGRIPRYFEKARRKPGSGGDDGAFRLLRAGQKSLRHCCYR